MSHLKNWVLNVPFSDQLQSMARMTGVCWSRAQCHDCRVL
uniref:Uncharacterized protein n=1 Tax=Setaria italica TaxID=4555 RepID=K3Y465_SETIT